MDAAWMSDFSANFYSGLAAGLLAPLLIFIVSKLFVRWTARPGLQQTAPASQSAGDHSNQTGIVYGPNNPTINDHRRYETTFVQQYLERESAARPSSSSSEMDGWWIFLAALVGVVIGLLYVLYAPLFVAAAIGMCVSLVVTAVAITYRTKTLLSDWPEGAGQALASVVVAVVGTTFLGVVLLTNQQGNLSLSTLQEVARLGYATELTVTTTPTNPISVFLTKLFAAGSSITAAFGMDGWRFFLGQTGAVVLTFEMLFLVFYRLLEWNTFLRFTTRTTRNRKALQRAMAFPEKKWTILGVTVICVFIAALIGSQWLYNGLSTGFTSLSGQGAQED